MKSMVNYQIHPANVGIVAEKLAERGIPYSIRTCAIVTVSDKHEKPADLVMAECGLIDTSPI